MILATALALFISPMRPDIDAIVMDLLFFAFSYEKRR